MHLATLDSEVETVKGGDPAERLDEVPSADHRLRHGVERGIGTGVSGVVAQREHRRFW